MKLHKGISIALVMSILIIALASNQPVQASRSEDISMAPLRATDLGGLDLDNYCHEKYYISNWSTWRDGEAYLSYYSPYGWKCNVLTVFLGETWTEYYGMDLNEACRMQKGSGAYAGLVGAQDPYSWHCFR